MEFKVGDIVESNIEKVKGNVGVVVRGKMPTSSYYAVKFDCLKGKLHNADGLCPDNNGWFLQEDELFPSDLDWSRITGCNDG